MTSAYDSQHGFAVRLRAARACLFCHPQKSKGCQRVACVFCMTPESRPIVIIGGGVIGSAIAYFLTLQQPQCPVVVVERDPTYARASSALSASSIRQQFSTDINIQMSAYGIGFLRDVGRLLACDGDVPAIGLHEGGYLYLATPEGEATLRENHVLQKQHGADVALLSPAQLQERFGWLALQGVSLGSLGLSGEGWFDGYQLLMALRKKAQRQGVRYVADEAVGFEMVGTDGVQHVHAVRLQSGEIIPCRFAVNAGGPWAAAIASWAGIDLPVVGKRRTVFHLASPAALPGCPLLIDTSGIWLRPEGQGFICGFAPAAGNDADFAPLEPEYDAFENLVWPTLAERIPGFEALRLQGAWAGYYEMNTFDHNALVGLHPECDNLVFANGFSGHGLQQSPAVGRGLAELMLTGRYQSLDLSPVSIQRWVDKRPLLEKNVI